MPQQNTSIRWSRGLLSLGFVVCIAVVSGILARFEWAGLPQANVASDVNQDADTIDASSIVGSDSEFASSLSASELETLKLVPKESVSLYSAALCIGYTSPLNSRAVAVVIESLENGEAAHVSQSASPTDMNALVCLAALSYAIAREGCLVADLDVLAGLAIAYSRRIDINEKNLGTLLAWTLLAEVSDPPPLLRAAFAEAISNPQIKSDLPALVMALGKYRRMGNQPPLEYAGLSTGKAD